MRKNDDTYSNYILRYSLMLIIVTLLRTSAKLIKDQLPTLSTVFTVLSLVFAILFIAFIIIDILAKKGGMKKDNDTKINNNNTFIEVMCVNGECTEPTKRMVGRIHTYISPYTPPISPCSYRCDRIEECTKTTYFCACQCDDIKNV